MSIIKIKHGITFQGKLSYSGIILFIVGIYIMINRYMNGEDFSFKSFFGLFLLLIGILLFLSIRGVLIDKENNRIKPYLFMILKIGKWESLDDFDTLVLKYVNLTQSLGSRFSATTIHLESFDIVLSSENKKDIILKESINYEKALFFLDDFSHELNKPVHNAYEEMKQKIQERKQYIRR